MARVYTGPEIAEMFGRDASWWRRHWSTFCAAGFPAPLPRPTARSERQWARAAVDQWFKSTGGGGAAAAAAPVDDDATF
jgi:hypothetical protein